MNLTNYIDEIPNFPKDGILFKDICPLLRSPEAWTFVIQQLGFFCEELQPDYIAGIKSRGFIVGSSLSTAEKIPFVPIRKGGKLPGNVIGVDYTLEYGQDRLEVQSNIFKGSKVVTSGFEPSGKVRWDKDSSHDSFLRPSIPKIYSPINNIK